MRGRNGREAEVAFHEAEAGAPEVEQHLTLEDEERLFERVQVPLDLRAGGQLDEADGQMHGAVLRAEVLGDADATPGLAGVLVDEGEAVAADDVGPAKR